MLRLGRHCHPARESLPRTLPLRRWLIFARDRVNQVSELHGHVSEGYETELRGDGLEIR